MLKYEFKILFSKRVNRLILLGLLIIAIVFSLFAVWSINFVDGNGTVHKGLLAPRKLTECRSQYKGKLTSDVLARVIQREQAINEKYGNAVPNDAYAKNGQEYGDITEMIVSILCYDKEYDETEIDRMSPDQRGNIYAIREHNITREIEEYGSTQIKSEYMSLQYEKVPTPMEYSPAESWKTMGLYATTYAIILLIVISFLAAGIFSEEFRLHTDSIFFTTRLGRSKGTRIKIGAGLIMATGIYWIAAIVLSIISFGVMGVSGAQSPIQIEDSYCIYAYTFMQKYLVILISGYVGSLLAATTAMLVSAKTHSSLLAMCVPFLLFIVSPFVGQVLPFKTFFNITPDQLLNVYNCTRLPLLYQFGDIIVMQIPMLIMLYSLITIILIPFVYRAFSKEGRRNV